MTVQIFDYLYPRYCSACGILLGRQDRRPVCRNCEAALERIRPPYCSVCGRPLISEQDTCMYCRERDFLFDRNRSVFEYRGNAALLLRAYKFQGQRGLALFFADMAASILEKPAANTLLMPVPGNPKSKRKRGWDQAAVIVTYLAAVYGYHTLEGLGRKASAQQKSLNYDQRSGNLRGKIWVKPKGRVLQGKYIILVDDVMTTGASLNECTRVLLNAGCAGVSSVTIAID